MGVLRCIGGCCPRWGSADVLGLLRCVLAVAMWGSELRGCSQPALAPGGGCGCGCGCPHLLQQFGHPLQFLDGFGAFELH